MNGTGMPCWRVDLETELGRFRPIVRARTADEAEARAREIVVDIAGRTLPIVLRHHPVVHHPVGFHHGTTVRKATGRSPWAHRVERNRIQRQLAGELG